MTYKALFLDLDGTTVPNRPDGMPSPRVRAAIHAIKPRMHVCVATSRPLYIAKNILDHLDIRGLCVVNDSTQIYDPVAKKFLQTIFIDNANLPEIFTIAKQYSDNIQLNSGKSERILTKGKIKERICSIYVGEIDPIPAERLVSDMTKIPNIEVHKIPAWQKGKIAISISHAMATKLHGVEEILRILNISSKEVIGVGDGYNDFPLLMACGLKIAMGNAVPELKAIADFIAPSVEEDGVATVIEKFILNE